MKGIAIPPMALISKLMQRPNRNLLDNPWFTVNQRGFTTTTARSSAYGFDRWIGTYRYNSNPAMAFSANEYAFQFFEDSFKNELHGKTVTVSVKYSDGTIEHGTCTYQKNPSEFVTIFNGKVNVAIGYDADSSSHINGAIAITGLQSCNVAAIKLELGSLSTLKYDIAPNYTEELLKCQRYFFTNDFSNPTTPNLWRNWFIAITQNSIAVNYQFPVLMRGIPSIVIKDNLIRNQYTGDIITIISIADIGCNQGQLGGLYNINPASFAVGGAYGFVFTASADL